LHEVEQVADRIGVINGGRLMAVERIHDLKEKAVHEVEVHFGSEVPVAELSGIANVEAVHIDGHVARFRVKGSVDALIKVLAAHEVIDVIAQEADLEEIFFAYYERTQ
jgi:ABC-2 type transport system ATP-binding protein